jgi:uncharacterized protein with HEPN domain
VKKEKLDAALTECIVHAQVLQAALTALATHRPFDAETVRSMSTQLRQQLDQVAYRFMKLQDTLGDRVLPGLVELAEEPLPESATFQQKLNRLERLGVIDSAEDWRILRETRNQIAHEYPDAPAIQAAMLEALLNGTQKLIAVWQGALHFASQQRNHT